MVQVNDNETFFFFYLSDALGWEISGRLQSYDLEFLWDYCIVNSQNHPRSEINQVWRKGKPYLSLPKYEYL